MSPDEIAHRYQHVRPAFHLADCIPVGLPIYIVTTRILTLSRKPIPPIDEFTLKCVGSGLNSTGQISDFLGLDERVVRGTLVKLAQMECVALLRSESSRSQSLQLTRKGKLSLMVAETEEPEEREFKIYFDGLLRKAAWYERFERMRFEELKDKGMLEIHAYPPKRPQLSDLDVREVERIVRTLGNPEYYKKDLLAVRRLEYVQKLYLAAVALVYAANEGNNVQVAFVIDGKLATEHELAYSKMGGPKRQGIEKGIKSSLSARESSQELRQQLGINEEQLRAKEGAALNANLTIEECERSLRSTDDAKEREDLRQKLNELDKARKSAESDLSEFPVQNLYMLDHPPLLEDALVNTKHRLLVISPWITGKVVGSDFLSKLEGLLQKGVDAYIGYGITAESTENPDPRDQAAKASLDALSRRYPKFRFKRLGNTHAKVLIKDSEFAAVTSFNWLSFKGDPNRTFRDEQGVRIQDSRMVDQKFNELAGRFSE